jgi:hypothetical protein
LALNPKISSNASASKPSKGVLSSSLKAAATTRCDVSLFSGVGGFPQHPFADKDLKAFDGNFSQPSF